jgi:glycosyltransferase involved in cell wall biosynthesis
MIGQKGMPASYGGIERHVEELSTRLAARGHEVSVYCRPYYSRTGGTYRGVHLVRLPSIRTKHLDAASHSLISTLHALGTRADLLHFHALGPASLSILPRIFRVPAVATVHGLDWQREKWGPFARAVLKGCEACSTRFADRTIVVSETLSDYYARRHGREVVYIPNGTNPAPFRPPELIRGIGLEGGDYLLFVGRLVPEKGCHLLLDAFEGLATDKKLVVAGSSSFSDEYTASLKRRASDRILFLDWVEGRLLEELWSNAYLVVQPSTLEGLSIALLEALSYGRCVVVSDIPENMEVVGDAGASFRSGDAADLRRKLETLLAAPDRAAKLGEAARERAGRHFAWDLVTEQTEKVYLEVLAARQRGRRRHPAAGVSGSGSRKAGS